MIEKIEIEKKTGNEQFEGTEHTLLEYWSWAHSDIASNAERGKLAEYIVHCAVHSKTACRTEWDAYDILSEEGIKIEVKSSAYLQTWRQDRFFNIQFDIAPKNAWNSETNTYSESKCRSADVYVFCLFTSRNAKSANPLNLEQWEFYVLSTRILNEQVPHQKSIGLNALLRLGAVKVDFNAIHCTIKACLEYFDTNHKE